MRSASALLICLLPGLLCCGKGNFFSAPVAAPVTVAPITRNYAYYHSYGDSITAGYGLSSTSLLYVSLAAAYNSLPLTNNAISGDESCDLSTRQIFPAADSPSLARPALYTMLIGTNDVDIRGAGAGEATFNVCHQAALSWLATPLETKLLSTAATVSVQGASHYDPQSGFNAVVTDAAGGSISFPFSRPFASAVYLWYRLADSSSNSFTCALDGSAVATVLNATNPLLQTQNGSAISVGVLRLGGVSAGAHTLRCTQNGAGSSGMALLGIGWPPPAGTSNRPRLLAGLLPLQAYGSRAGTLAAYDTDIRASVSLFAADGLDVELFDAAAYMSGTSADMADSIHPNAAGQQEIFQALQQALQK